MKVIMFTKNLRNTLPKRMPELLGGEKISYGHHPWAGITRLDGDRCDGTEHVVHVEDWRYDELLKQNVRFSDETEAYKERAEKERRAREKAATCQRTYTTMLWEFCRDCGQLKGYHNPHRSAS